MPSIAERIYAANRGRIPHLLEKKYVALSESPFRFFRGTAHLFYEDWSFHLPHLTVPNVWSCADVHLENFGSYKGNNRLVYFDLNDFDEAVLAPCVMDLARFATSIHLAANALRLRTSAISELVALALLSYSQTLAQGKAQYIERDTALGMVRTLLKTVQKRTRREFLDKRTEKRKGKRRFFLDGTRYEAASQTERDNVQAALHLVETEIRKGYSSPEARALEIINDNIIDVRFFDFTILDVAHRIAGTGSLGVERYAVLIEGKGSPDSNYILDLKEATTTAATPALGRVNGLVQPIWENEAERSVRIQERIQAATPALLHTARMGDKSYILRELQPAQDKLNLTEQWNGNMALLQGFIATAAQVLAWAHLRGSGREGSACADEIMDFGAAREKWQQALTDYAREYAARVHEDWQAFRGERAH